MEGTSDTASGGVPRNANGAKAIGGLLALVAVIAGVYAMVEPMGQRLDFIRDHVKLHDTLHAHSGAVADLAKITVQFTEVETQFHAMEVVVGLHVESLRRRLDEAKRRCEELEQRLRTLEIVRGVQ